MTTTDLDKKVIRDTNTDEELSLRELRSEYYSLRMNGDTEAEKLAETAKRLFLKVGEETKTMLAAKQLVAYAVQTGNNMVQIPGTETSVIIGNDLCSMSEAVIMVDEELRKMDNARAVHHNSK